MSLRTYVVYNAILAKRSSTPRAHIEGASAFPYLVLQ